jgi:ribonuclease P protein component
VAYAVGRRVGGAVARNRLRRRLRAVVRAEAEHLVPGHAYLVGAGPAATTVSHRELRTAFRAIADDLRAAAEAGP